MTAREFTLAELDHLTEHGQLTTVSPLAAFARRLLVEREGLRDTAALLYADVEAQRRVIMQACEALRVTDDDENDWPKLGYSVEFCVRERDALRATVDRLRSALAPPITNLLDFRGTAKLTHYGAPLGWEAARNGPAVCATCGGGCVAYVNNQPSGCKHTPGCAALAQEAALDAYRRRTEPDALRALLADAPAGVPATERPRPALVWVAGKHRSALRLDDHELGEVWHDGSGHWRHANLLVGASDMRSGRAALRNAALAAGFDVPEVPDAG